nr:MAG TPA: hypothetical protein [Caudoviricetes sp.]
MSIITSNSNGEVYKGFPFLSFAGIAHSIMTGNL